MPTARTANSFIFLATGNKEIVESYKSVVEGQKDLSLVISETLPEYAIGLVNPANHDLFLLVTMNGVVIYNFMDDL